MNEIRAVTIDLDDTLWPIDPVIAAAEERLYEWLAANCPEITRRYSVESIREIRISIVATHGDVAHDVTAVRRRSLERLIVAEGGYPEEYVDLAMEEFLVHRNKVEFFPDAVPFLNRVSASLPLLSISNGNADLHRIGVSGLFAGHVTATEAGVAKPDPKLFRAACERVGAPPETVLHIGDHPIQDILGAARAGMKTVWLNRTGARWNEEHSADHEVTSLEQVLDLLPLQSPGDPE